jgi:hypothetical protein
MTVPVTRQPNIEPGLTDQTSIMPFLVVCGTSHNSSRLESYGHEKLETIGLGNGPKFV